NLAAPLAAANIVGAPLFAAAGWKPGDGVPSVLVAPRAGKVPVDFGHVASTVLVVTGDASGSVVRELDLAGAERLDGGMSRPAHVARVDLAGLPVVREAQLSE